MQLSIEPISAEVFAPYGDLIQPDGEPTMLINTGLCGRYHDLAKLDFSDGRAGISVFDGTAYSLPLSLVMVERHPLGSQAFLPLSGDPFLVIVADDMDGIPQQPRVFMTQAGQGINYHRNIWHGVLTPIHRNAQFAVVDRIGDGDNLQEYYFDKPYVINE